MVRYADANTPYRESVLQEIIFRRQAARDIEMYKLILIEPAHHL